MIPDPATIARRRHLVTMLIRAGIVVLAGLTVWDFCAVFADDVWNLYNAGGFIPGYLIRSFLTLVPKGAALVGLIFLEPRIVRWVVPVPSAEPVCPKCGYSIRNLKSPVCPECGTSVR